VAWYDDLLGTPDPNADNRMPSHRFADWLWNAMPPEARKAFEPWGAMFNPIEWTPGAGIRDAVNASGDLSRATLRGDPVGMLTAAGGIALGAAGAIPGGKPVVKAADAIADTARAVNPLKAYHGSPHDFDKFDIGKIGGGEGSQMYGHGLYFAESEPVAKGYRDTLTTRTSNADAADSVQGILERAFGGGGDLEAARKMIEGNLRATEKSLARSQTGPWAGVSPELERARQNYAEALQRLPSYKPGGHMYEVNIHADPEKMLDWDAPVGQQPGWEAWRKSPVFKDRIAAEHFGYEPGEFAALPAEQRAALHDKVPAYVVDQYAKRPGREFHDLFEYETTKPEAARQLHAMGMPGIKYLDQGSRDAGQGTRNFVMFDDRLIEILKKYGFIPPALLGAATLPQMPDLWGLDDRGG
jgi:hypothetical protein